MSRPRTVSTMYTYPQEVLGRQALHAWRLAFTHPRTGKALKLEAPLPEDFEAALACLREGR